jgi:large subunit ribosomal protein L13
VPTFSPKPADIQRSWHVVDADGAVLGRMASEVARVLRGKHKPIYAPHIDCGDHVIVVNAEKVVVTSDKDTDKEYFRYSGYPGGLRRVSLRDQRERHPDRVIRAAVKGMLPKGRLGRQMIGKLKIYAGPTHPHAAQQPKVLALPSARRS